MASAWLIARIVGRLFPGSGASTWAALLYAVEPIGFLYSIKIMSEGLFCAELLLFVWLAISYFRKPSYGKLIWAAVVLGCATYTRPISLYLAVGLIPVFLFFPRGLPLVQRSSRSIVFLIVFSLSLAPWFIRNARAAEYPGFSAISDFALYYYNAAAVEAKAANKSFAQQQDEMGFWDHEFYLQAHAEQRGWSRGKVSRFMRVEAQRIILRHLPTYLVLHGRGLIIVLFDTGAMVLLQSLGLYPEHGGLLARTLDQGFYGGMMWLIREHSVVAFVFALLGIQLLFYYALPFLGLRRLDLATACLFGSIVLYFVLLSGGPLASGRMRAPIMPLVCALAAVTIASLRAPKIAWSRGGRFPLRRR